jgi:hypothetical protein
LGELQVDGSQPFPLLHFVNRLWVSHTWIPVHRFVVTSAVPQLLTYEVVVEAIREAFFAITFQPRFLVAVERTTIFVISDLARHNQYPLLLRKAGGRLSGAESSLKSSSRHSRANAIVAASAIETSGRLRGLENLSV